MEVQAQAKPIYICQSASVGPPEIRDIPMWDSVYNAQVGDMFDGVDHAESGTWVIDFALLFYNNFENQSESFTGFSRIKSSWMKMST